MNPMNGDHAEFEIQYANTKPEDRPDWPLPSFDARDWAKAFCKVVPGSDEGLMIAWFANALMRGYDEGAQREQAQKVTNSEWQPIETAPDDGTEVLIYSPKNGIRAVRYEPFAWSKRAFKWFIALNPGPSGGTYADSPTHWMPLPDPPAMESKK